MFSHQSCVMEYVRNLYISKSNDNTTTKNTIARQYTERRQLLCQLLLVIISGENDTQWIAFFFFCAHVATQTRNISIIFVLNYLTVLVLY